MTARPHDALFKSAFETPGEAAALMRELLPADVGAAIAWSTIRGETGSFIDATLADYHSDLLFSVQLHAGSRAPLYLLLEHQSTGDSAMPLRSLAYQVQIWNRMRKDPRRHRLPPVITVMIHHVSGGWTDARSCQELFDPAVLAIPGVASLIPCFSMIVEDLAQRSDEEIKGRSLGAFAKLALWLLRDARDPAQLLASFGAWISTMLEVERAPGGRESFARLITYMFRVVDPVHWIELHAKIRLLGRRAEETAMSIAEQLLEEGRKEGLEEGRKEGKKEGRKEGLEQGRIASLRHQLRHKFGISELDAATEARLRAAPPETIDRYALRVLTADSLAAVFAE